MKKNHCPSGHEYNETNTYRKCGRRYCRACRTQRSKAQWERVKAERLKIKKAQRDKFQELVEEQPKRYRY